MFERILAHRNISIALKTDYRDAVDQVRCGQILYTGAIDEFFDYELGELPYRSLRFDFRSYGQRQHQPVGTVNYPLSEDFTRITEMSHLTQEWSEFTTVAIEYPQAHERGRTIPYYPVPRDENMELHNRYVEFAKREAPNTVFAGRLGDYKYYNMDQAVGRALSLFRKLAAS
jgi:UDP-galactopyranose mutase